jgi:hypothetical protein
MGRALAWAERRDERGGTVLKSLIAATAVVTLIAGVVPWRLNAQQPPPTTETTTEIVPAPPKAETTTERVQTQKLVTVTEKVKVKKLKPQVQKIKTHRHVSTTTAPEAKPATGTTAPGPTTTAPGATTTAKGATTTAPPPPPPVIYAPPAPPAASPEIVSPAIPPLPAPEPSVGTSGTMPETAPKSLPHTASPLGLMLLSAFGAFSGAGFVRALRRRL